MSANTKSASAALDASKSANDRLTTIARSLGGSAALGLLAVAVTPELPAVVFLASFVGLVGGFLAKKLDAH